MSRKKRQYLFFAFLFIVFSPHIVFGFCQQGYVLSGGECVPESENNNRRGYCQQGYVLSDGVCEPDRQSGATSRDLKDNSPLPKILDFNKCDGVNSQWSCTNGGYVSGSNHWCTSSGEHVANPGEKGVYCTMAVAKTEGAIPVSQGNTTINESVLVNNDSVMCAGVWAQKYECTNGGYISAGGHWCTADGKHVQNPGDYGVNCNPTPCKGVESSSGPGGTHVCVSGVYRTIDGHYCTSDTKQYIAPSLLTGTLCSVKGETLLSAAIERGVVRGYTEQELLSAPKIDPCSPYFSSRPNNCPPIKTIGPDSRVGYGGVSTQTFNSAPTPFGPSTTTNVAPKDVDKCGGGRNNNWQCTNGGYVSAKDHWCTVDGKHVAVPCDYGVRCAVGNMPAPCATLTTSSDPLPKISISSPCAITTTQTGRTCIFGPGCSNENYLPQSPCSDGRFRLSYNVSGGTVDFCRLYNDGVCGSSEIAKCPTEKGTPLTDAKSFEPARSSLSGYGDFVINGVDSQTSMSFQIRCNVGTNREVHSPIYRHYTRDTVNTFTILKISSTYDCQKAGVPIFGGGGSGVVSPDTCVSNDFELSFSVADGQVLRDCKWYDNGVCNKSDIATCPTGNGIALTSFGRRDNTLSGHGFITSKFHHGKNQSMSFQIRCYTDDGTLVQSNVITPPTQQETSQTSQTGSQSGRGGAHDSVVPADTGVLPFKVDSRLLGDYVRVAICPPGVSQCNAQQGQVEGEGFATNNNWMVLGTCDTKDPKNCTSFENPINPCQGQTGIPCFINLKRSDPETIYVVKYKEGGTEVIRRVRVVGGFPQIL